MRVTIDAYIGGLPPAQPLTADTNTLYFDGRIHLTVGNTSFEVFPDDLYSLALPFYERHKERKRLEAATPLVNRLVMR